MANQQQTTIDVLAAPVPAARVENLVITDVGDEVLVYDEVQHHIHHLNRASTVLWRLCDRQRGVSDLVRLARPELGAAVDEDVICLALEELEKAELLEQPLNPQVHVPTQTRRAVMKRLAVVGGAGLVAAVASITAVGPAAAAGSCTTSNCNHQCCGGVCCNHSCCNNVCCSNSSGCDKTTGACP